MARQPRQRRQRRFDTLDHLDRADPAEVARARGREQVQADVGRRGAVRDHVARRRPAGCRAAGGCPRRRRTRSNRRQVSRATSWRQRAIVARERGAALRRPRAADPPRPQRRQRPDRRRAASPAIGYDVPVASSASHSTRPRPAHASACGRGRAGRVVAAACGRGRGASIRAGGGVLTEQALERAQRSRRSTSARAGSSCASSQAALASARPQIGERLAVEVDARDVVAARRQAGERAHAAARAENANATSSERAHGDDAAAGEREREQRRATPARPASGAGCRSSSSG